MNNIILETDAYKLTHWLQRKPGITNLYSYGEPRKGGKYDHISFFGLQMIIQDHLMQPVTDAMIDEAEEASVMTFGTKRYFDRVTWEKVRDLGYLPIRIKAVREGSRVNINNVCFTVESTERWFAPHLSVVEDILMHCWYPTTVATRAMHIKEAIKPYFNVTSDIGDIVLPFAVNDFGLRGATCLQAAQRGGAAFLVHFEGSDNMPAGKAIKDYYDYSGRLKSVWATEHSVATSYGLAYEEEVHYLDHQLEFSDPDKTISIVIDSNDSDEFIRTIVSSRKSKIIAREGRVVFRPDSGDPLTNILKYLDILGGIFGYHINNKGYKVLNHNVGLIQGDGMDEDSIPSLYRNVTNAGWAADNFVTGSGGGLLQKGIDRDTSRWAIKASYQELSKDVGDGTGQMLVTLVNLQKSPKTDMTKASKTGRLKLLKGFQNMYNTISLSGNQTKEIFNGYVDELETVFEKGVQTKDSFENILKRANDQ